MRKIIEDVNFIQDGTMVFGDIHLENGFVERIDYKSLKMNSNYAINGFVDLHTHGFRGGRCDSLDAEELENLAIEYAKRGVVGFCPTIMARPLVEYEEIIKVYQKVFQGEYKGARFLGIHMEGPYLNPSMSEKSVQEIDVVALEAFMKKYHNMISIMTIAPEVKYASEAIKILHRYGIIISLGYSCADYSTAMKAIDEGATQITHLCNTMEALDYKKAGLIDAAFTSDIMCEIDMDGVHINHIMLEWVMKLIGTKRILGITNGGKYCGFEYPDNFELENGGIVKNRVVYIDGAASESTKDLLEIFQYLLNSKKFTLSECIRMTSSNALQRLHCMNGEISLGKKVNLVVLDHGLELKDVIINGKSIGL